MRTILQHILMLTAVVTSCNKTDIFDNRTIGGKEVQIELSINGEGLWSEAITKSYALTANEEKQIKSLEVLIFNSANKLISRTRLENPETLRNQIKTKSGSQMKVYVVANTSQLVNASSTPNDVLGMVTTLSDLKNIKVTNLLIDVGTNKTLMMYGFLENVNINPTGDNSVDIQLNYVAAKVSVNLRTSLPTGESFELVDWKLGSLARYSYIFPKLTDAVNPNNIGSDFATQVTGNTWSDGVIDVSGVQTAVKTTTFYLFENRRGSTSNNDPKLKSGDTAPVGASKFLARGYYKTSSAIIGIDIVVMFGANSVNDYNVERRNEYVYNINVLGFNDIAVETRYKDAGAGFQAEILNTTLDAHYDFRPIKIGAYQGKSVVSIIDENGIAAGNSFWLKVSEKNITKFINNGSGIYIRPTYNPVTEMLQNIGYTHKQQSAMDFKMFYLYSDEFLTDNGVRTATVVIRNDQNGVAQLPPITYTITQRGCLVAGRVGMRVINSLNKQTSTDYILATEIYEEATMAITPGNLVNERTSTMQWGYSGVTKLPFNDHTRRDGFDNTQNLVLSNITNGTLLNPYARVGNSALSSHQLYDPIYNTYAARYCFEKNRDINGDGVIKGSEIKWYLPSLDEQLLIYAGNTSWSLNASDRWIGTNVYLSSIQNSAVEAMASRLSTGLTGSTPNNSPLYVRCVRQLQIP